MELRLLLLYLISKPYFITFLRVWLGGTKQEYKLKPRWEKIGLDLSSPL